MLGVTKALLTEEYRRKANGDNRLIPMRPDHGHQMLDDLKKNEPRLFCDWSLKRVGRISRFRVGIKKSIF